MLELKAYQATDGKLFYTKEDCKFHESRIIPNFELARLVDENKSMFENSYEISRIKNFLLFKAEYLWEILKMFRFDEEIK